MKTKVDSLFRTYRLEAKKRAWPFMLPFDLFKDLLTDSCYYCGEPPEPYNGIDRVDNSRGYFEDNVVTACKQCNLAKAKGSQIDYIHWLARVLNRLTTAT
jgi:hypothetical protein